VSQWVLLWLLVGSVLALHAKLGSWRRRRCWPSYGFGFRSPRFWRGCMDDLRRRFGYIQLVTARARRRLAPVSKRSIVIGGLSSLRDRSERRGGHGQHCAGDRGTPTRSMQRKRGITRARPSGPRDRTSTPMRPRSGTTLKSARAVKSLRETGRTVTLTDD
jgi:hypothetical protein